MRATEAQRVLQSLLDGVDPITGEIFPEDHVCNRQLVIRALLFASNVLEQKITEKEASKRARPANAGATWNVADDKLLIELFKSGKSVSELSIFFRRTSSGIRARLVRLGLYDSRRDVPEFYNKDE